MKRFFLIFFVLIQLFACNKIQSCFDTNGKTGSRKVLLDSFNTLSVNNLFNIELLDSSEYSISIMTKEKNIKNIGYKIENGELMVNNLKNCQWLVKSEYPTIVVSSPNLKQINIYNPCKITSSNNLKYKALNIQTFSEMLDIDISLDCDSLHLVLTGAGVYKFKGNANFTYLYTTNSGYFMGEDFETKKMHLVHKSLGTDIFSVTEKLYVEYIDYANVFLLSCPVIEVKEDYKKWIVRQSNCE